MEQSTTTSDTATSRGVDVCSLPTDEWQDRSAMIRREILPLVTRREALESGMALEFEHSPALRKRLEDFIAFERECCSGLTWQLHRPSSRVLRLKVEGLPVDSDFFGTSGGGADAPTPGRLARLAQASGLGAGVSFFFCCVLPIGVAVIAGPALAAPLGKLDDPLFIAAGSVVLGVPAWFWLKRRATRSTHSTGAGCGDGC